MKCESCGGALGADMNFCPFCGVRAEVDLKSIHFRDLGAQPDLPCPDCRTPLNAAEFGSDQKATIERCPGCYGLFFNPGELELVLEAETAPLIWLDPKHLEKIARTYHRDEEIIYLKCPICHERMSHQNFGGRSGIILDFCGSHGVWVQNGEFRRIAEWWRAGGKLYYEAEQKRKAERLSHPVNSPRATPGPIELPADKEDTEVLGIVGKILGFAYDVWD